MIKALFIKNKNIFFFLTGFLSLIIGYNFAEDSAGGARHDSELLSFYVELFSNNFFNSLSEYDLDHSPIFYIFQSLFYTNNLKHDLFSYFYIFLSLLIPIIFFYGLSFKYKKNRDYLFLFSLLIFLSPYFRSSAIWSLGDNLSSLFFCTFSLFFLKSERENFFGKNNFICLILIILASYIRPIYCVFWIFLFYQRIKLFSKVESIKFIITSFLFSIPALYYLIFNLILNDKHEKINSFLNLNFFEISIVVSSILTFYIFPFIIHDYKNLIKFFKNNLNKFLSLFFILLSLFLIDYFLYKNLISINKIGGGVFYKLSLLLKIDFHFLMLFSSYLGIVLYYYISNGKNLIYNFSLLGILILYCPTIYIFQKFLDPLFFFVFFLLIKSDTLIRYFENKQFNLTIIYTYFASFLLFSIFYYKLIS